MGTVSKTGADDTETWFVKLNMEGLRVKFKIDTSADVTVMNEETFNSLGNKMKLSHTQARYDSPGGRINCLGQFETTTEYKDKKFKFTIHVMEGDTVNNLLSREQAIEMGLVKRIEQVRAAFGEQGTIKTELVKINLKENAEPYAVHTSRRVPLPLLPKVKAEIEENGVIEKITQPTDWYMQM